MKKRVDDKLKSLKERQVKLPEMEQKLDKLKARYAVLEERLRLIEWKPTTALIIKGKGAKEKKRKRKEEDQRLAEEAKTKTAKTDSSVDSIDDDDDECVKLSVAKKKEIDAIKKEYVDPSIEALQRQLAGVDSHMAPELERILLKRRRLKELAAEIAALQGEVDIIRGGKEVEQYWLNSAKYILEFEEEKRVEKLATAEMARFSAANGKLSKYLERLPITAATKRQRDDEGPSLSSVGGSGGADDGEARGRKKRPAPDLGILGILQPSMINSTMQLQPIVRDKEILAEYMAEVEHDESRKNHLLAVKTEEFSGLCRRPFCRGELVEDFVHDHLITCSRCGMSEFALPEKDVGTFNEPTLPIQVPFAYKKKNHFRDWLAKSQGKENTTIPQVVYDSLLQELKKMRLHRAEDVTRKVIRKLLKKLKMSRYYHNSSQLLFHLVGIHPPQFSR